MSDEKSRYASASETADAGNDNSDSPPDNTSSSPPNDDDLVTSVNQNETMDESKRSGIEKDDEIPPMTVVKRNASAGSDYEERKRRKKVGAVPDDAAITDIPFPTDLRRHDHSRPGAYHEGGSGNGTSYDLTPMDGESSPEVPIPPPLSPLSSSQPLISATLVKDTESDDSSSTQYDEETAQGAAVTVATPPTIVLAEIVRSRNRFIFVCLGIMVLVAVGLGVSLLVTDVRDGDDDKINQQPDRPPRDGNSRDDGDLPSQDEVQTFNATNETVTLHVVTWGAVTTCENEFIPLELTCSFGRISILDEKYASCEVIDHEASCRLTDPGRAGWLLYSCRHFADDEEYHVAGDDGGGSVAHIPLVAAFTCNKELRQVENATGVTAVYGGRALQYLSLGNFCRDHGEWKLHPNHDCYLGHTLRILYNSRRRLQDYIVAPTSVVFRERQTLCYDPGNCTVRLQCTDSEDLEEDIASCEGDTSCDIIHNVVQADDSFWKYHSNVSIEYKVPMSQTPLLEALWDIVSTQWINSTADVLDSIGWNDGAEEAWWEL